MKKIILITGASGSGGSYLAEHILKKKNSQVFGLIRNKKKKQSYNLKILKKYKNFDTKVCNLNNIKILVRLINLIKPSIIFHLASNADVRKSFFTPHEIVKKNNECTLNLLEAVRLSKINPRIMICSTAEVYGNVQKKYQPISESNKINPINPYAVSKTFQDLIAQNYCSIYKMDIVITRMFTYLNARRQNLFASAFTFQILKFMKSPNKKHILRHGNLNSLRTLLDIRDAMEAYWLAATKGKRGEIYNICGEIVISVRSFLNEIIKLSKLNVIKKLDKNLLRPNDISIQLADCTKFKKHTGWKPKVKLNETIKFFFEECIRKYKNKS
jgi:GDP-4-dehydro-6-deoxy-D-mannose reductase